MIYVFDTNILLHEVRQSDLFRKISLHTAINEAATVQAISFATVAETKSIAYRRQWGSAKLSRLQAILDSYLTIDQITVELIERYVEIEAYSQGKHISRRGDFSARNMGKNDLWIAATASVLGATLLTTDQDFNHIDGIFASVEYFAPIAG